MVARGFARNTNWKIITAAVEEVMTKSELTYNSVQVTREID